MWNIIIFGFILVIILGVVIYYITKKKSNDNAIFNCILTILTGFIFLLTIVLVWQTNYIQDLTSNDVPNYPTKEHTKEITKTYSYIETRFGNYIIYEVDYLIKYSKMKPPESYNVSILLPTKVDGFIFVEELRGFKIDLLYDAPNDTVEIINLNNTNPLTLSVAYVSENHIDPELLTTEEPLPDIKNNSISNNSFFVKIKNSGGYDIKTLRHHSNVTKWINDYLRQLDSSSWIDQPIMIYENGLPVAQTIINDKGIIAWDITSMNSGEQKIYYFKKIKEHTYNI